MMIETDWKDTLSKGDYLLTESEKALLVEHDFSPALLRDTYKVNQDNLPEIYDIADGAAKDIGVRQVDVFVIIDSNDLEAIRTGWRKGVIILGTGNIEDFSEKGLEGALAHEEVHLIQTFRKLFNKFLEMIDPKPPSRYERPEPSEGFFASMVKRHKHAQEFDADRRAAKAVGPVKVIDVLRTGIELGEETDPNTHPSFEERIKRLERMKGNGSNADICRN